MNEVYCDIDWDMVMVQMSSKEVGKRIAKFRVDLGMSVDNLARKLNRSRSTVSRIERGTQELTVEQIGEIAEILEVNSFDLLAD